MQNLNKKTAIQFVKRKPQPHYHSIEKVFDTLIETIAETNKTETVFTRYYGASPLVLLKNIIHFKKVKERVNHITGDVHYMALITGKKTLLTIHDVGSAKKGNPLKNFYIKLLWFWLPAVFVKKITVISEFTKQELAAIIPFAKNKIQVVYNPVATDYNFQPKPFNSSKPQLLFIGTKVNKNLTRFIHAIGELNCTLNIIGQLSTRQIEELNKYKIDFTNVYNISNNEVIAAYEACDILCFPSTYEGFGMPIIEAQAIGRPVLTSNRGAMKEIAKDSACLIDPEDITSIIEGLQQIIKDRTYREQLISKGQTNVKRFNVENIAKQYLNLYNEIETP